MATGRIRTAGANEAGHIKGLTMGDPYYYTSDQSIGEGKHGLWRVQDDGTIREYRKADAQGLEDGAGLDVSELYTKVLRVDLFPDIGGDDEGSVDWQAVDISKTNAEFYLIERPFFNDPYLFITAVFDNLDNQDFQYIRPAGDYYASLQERGDTVETEATCEPRFHLENDTAAAARGLPVYGIRHPNCEAFGGGGACPLKGGD